MTHGPYDAITLDIDARGVATLTLNRPDKHNALNGALIADLFAAAHALRENEAVRLVVLTGAGPSFCSGGDFNWFQSTIEKARPERVAESANLAALFNLLDTLPQPVIGRINGPAYGGGTGLMSICDYAIGVAGSRFGLSEVRLGLLPANIAPYVVARIGAGAARAAMLSGAPFDAARALRIGLLAEVVEEGELDAAVDRAVALHLEAAPGAAAATKRLIAYVDGRPVADSMIYTADRLADAWDSEEGLEGIASFLEKRKPAWRP